MRTNDPQELAVYHLPLAVYVYAEWWHSQGGEIELWARQDDQIVELHLRELDETPPESLGFEPWSDWGHPDGWIWKATRSFVVPSHHGICRECDDQRWQPGSIRITPVTIDALQMHAYAKDHLCSECRTIENWDAVVREGYNL